MHKTIISLEVNRYEFHYKGESADLGGKNGDLLWVYLLFAPGGTAVSAINPGNASVPGRPCEHASAAEYLQRDIANSNSNLHSNNIHCIILYYSSIQLIGERAKRVRHSQVCSIENRVYIIIIYYGTCKIFSYNP